MRRLAPLLSMVAVVVMLWVTSAVAAEVKVEPGAAGADAFVAAAGCTCHGPLVQQWSRSMHNQALTDPIYLTKLEEAKKATDGKLGPFCLKCHGPVAVMAGQAEGERSPSAANAVGCSFCHQVVGIDGHPGNTNQIVETDGIRRAQIKDPQAPHPAQYSELHEKAEFCGACHNVMHPINGMHLESTYEEWSKSPYAEEGVVCQDCHMSAAPGQRGPAKGSAAVGAPQRDNIYQMTFVGANRILGPADAAEAMLKSAATMEITSQDIVAPGSESSLSVKITNSGAGHYLPTGLTEVRQMWLEVYAESDAGSTKLGERRFGTVLADDKGNHPVELWDATQIHSDDRIPPKQSVTADFKFDMPEGQTDLNLKAVLKYQSVDDEFAAKAGVDNPVTEMAVAQAAVYDSEQTKATAQAEQAKQEQGGGGAPNTLVVGLGALSAVAIAAGVFFLTRGRAS